MKLVQRLAVSTALVAIANVMAPHAAFAVCASGGTVVNINDCIAEKPKPNECMVEWSVSPVPPIDIKTNQPTAKIVCTDNDPACDVDTTPGQCTFNVAVCLNVTDGRFTCAPGPTDAATFIVKKPSAKDASKPSSNRFAHDNRFGITSNLDGLVPTGTDDVCSDEQPFVVALKKGKKATYQIQAQVDASNGDKDKDKISFTCIPNPAIATDSIASARQITASGELIGGPLATGRIGDWIIENDRVRFVVRDLGRDFSFMLTYGGHIMDADFQRSGPGRDNFLGMTSLINISSSDNPTSITVLNDGTAGGPAVLQTSGPDDLFDPIDPAVAITGFNDALSIPPLAIDNNIPVTVVSEYTLAPGDDFVKIETIVNNTGGSTLNLYVGDYTSSGGQQEVVATGLGFGDAALRLGGSLSLGEQTYDFLGWFGFGESQGVSYGLIPQAYDLTSSFTQSGVVVPVYGQSILGVLVPDANDKPPGALTVTAGGNNSFTRWFGLSNNGMGGVLDFRHKLVARGDIVDPLAAKTGWVYGTVRVGGVPVDGARVSVFKSPGLRTANFALIDAFETKNGGAYQGTLPKGEYLIAAKIPGYKYEGGGASPILHELKIAGGTRVVDFDVPATGFVRVDVTNGVTTDPLPAKVSVVGLQAAPEPPIRESVVFLSFTGNLFGYDAREKVSIYGLPQVQFAGVSGSTAVFPVPPGSYQIVVSHGPEYSATTTPLTVVAGTAASPQVITTALVPVVDTTGFISADHHVHLSFSPDSTVSKDERIVTMLAEGVDYFVASNHDFKTDLASDVAALGASSLVKTAVSNEITYFDSGHFGAYPLDLVPGSVTGGAIDWGRAGEPVGLGYPSDGSYDLSVEEMALAAKAPPHNAAVVQANHFNSGTLGYFRTSGIDTTVAPPQSSTDPIKIRQDPAVTNLFSNELTALELWIESSRDQNALALGENLGDYISMLNNFDSSNPLLRKGIVCDSDTHSTAIVQAGGPRNMLASATDDPALLDPDALADAVNDGRNVCTSGPFVRVKVIGDAALEASHDLADPLIVTAATTATVQVDVQSPTWAQYDRIDIYVNTVPSCVTTPPNFLGSTKKLCTATPTFQLNPVVSTVPVNGNFRLQSSTSQNIAISQDSWIMVVVRGRDGVSKPLFPMNPQSTFARACSGDPCRSCVSTNPDCSSFFAGTCIAQNLTAADLVDGNLGQCGVTTLAIANPLFVDQGGDGLYEGVALP